MFFSMVIPRLQQVLIGEEKKARTTVAQRSGSCNNTGVPGSVTATAGKRIRNLGVRSGIVVAKSGSGGPINRT